MNETIELHGRWRIKAPLPEVFAVMTDFERLPDSFPKVAESVRILSREGDCLEMEATVRSFGRTFPVLMNTRILPGRGFISDNESPEFGTSGHEELFLSESPEETVIDYTYHITIHNRWLRVVARPLIGWFSMKFWEKAVIEELRKRLER